MPPFIKVPSLYVLSVNNFANMLYDHVKQSKGNINKMRNLVITSLHPGIKEHLVEISTKKYRSDTVVLFSLLEILLDRSTKKLHAVDEENSLWLPECSGLYTKLELCQAIGLEDLSIRVQLNPRNDLKYVSNMNSSFYCTLSQMTRLRVLVLRSVCDNEILRLLGKNCPNLEYLDVTSSWLVDDKGIGQILLRDPESCVYDEVGEYGLPKLDGFENRTACCLNLLEVRIQDTNTSITGVLLLLLLASRLRSLGGFIYYRDVGDAVAQLASSNPSLTLSLAELWDTHLPKDKAEIIGKAAPNLSVLYTRADCLSSVSAANFPYLTSLTVDFDFHDQARLLEGYLQLRGGRLCKLSLVDQTYPVSLYMLGKYCPSLTELNAKVYGGGHWASRSCRGGSKPLLPALHTARLRLSSNRTLRAILGGCPDLCHLELTPEDVDDLNRPGVGVFCLVRVDWPKDELENDSDGDDEEGPHEDQDDEPEDDQDYEDYEDISLSDAGIVEGLALNPTSRLTSFVTLRDWRCGTVGLRSLIHSCSKLKSIGDLRFWKGIRGGSEEVAALGQEALECNWDISLIYEGKTYPKRKGYPLWCPPLECADTSDNEEDCYG